MAHACTCKAIVLVSLGQQKVNRLLSDRPQLERRIAEMALALRNQPGVRHIEAVIIQAWRSDSHSLEQAPWKPAGALLFIESKDEAGVQKAIEGIWTAAKPFDQEIMVLNGIDSW